MEDNRSFTVRYADAKGATFDEVVKAPTKEEAIAAIRGRNLYPIAVKEKTVLNSDINIKFRERVKIRDLAVFCRQLAAMFGAGMPINRALDIQIAQTENLTLREVLKVMSENIKQGDSMSKSMKQFPEVFPPILLSMIESGEATGNIDEVLARMADHFISENKIKNQVTGAMVYPIVLVIVMIVIMAILMIFVIPTFTEMFSASGVPLPTITKIVIAISDFTKKFWFVEVLIAILIGVAFAKYKKSTNGKHRIDSILLSLPIVGSAVKQIITARFTRTLATLLESGVSIVSAISIAADTTDNEIVKNSMAIAVDGIKRGMSLTSELKKLDIFPLMMTSMVGIGEETGELDSLLKKTADYYDEELEAGIKKILALLEPLMLIVIGGIAGVVVVSIMLPMFMMSSGSV